MSLRTLIIALALVPIGFATKLYDGPAAFWSRAHLGGVVYVMFWTLLVSALRPRWNRLGVAAAVLAATCALEFLQLWNPSPLASVRSHPLGHALIGSTFSWADFPHYLIGAAMAAWLARRLAR